MTLKLMRIGATAFRSRRSVAIASQEINVQSGLVDPLSTLSASRLRLQRAFGASFPSWLVVDIAAKLAKVR